MTRIVRLLLLLCSLTACGGSECVGPTEPLEAIFLAAGEYSVQTIFARSDLLPLASSDDLRLVVDRHAGTVTLIYSNEGSIIREVWRIGQSEFGSLPFP